MKCPRCGLENRSHARFCKQCGQSLPAQASLPPSSMHTNLVCLACGATVKPRSRFCPRCGRPLPTAPTPPPPAQTPAYTPLLAQPPPPAYTQPPAMSPPFTAPPAPARRSLRWIWWVVGVAVLLCIIVVAVFVVLKSIGGGEYPAAIPTPTLALALVPAPDNVTVTARFAGGHLPAFQDALQEISSGRIKAEIIEANKTTIMPVE